MADAHALGACALIGVWVRLPPSPPFQFNIGVSNWVFSIRNLALSALRSPNSASTHCIWSRIMTSAKTTAKLAIDDIETFSVSFLRHLRAENHSPNTVDSYQESLKQFLEFLVSSGMPQEAGKITREHVEHFIEFLGKKAGGTVVIVC